MPYKAEKRASYWIVVDTRTGRIASYPTTKKKASAKADYMNRVYQELTAEEVA